MKIVKRFIQHWFNQELEGCDFWEEYKKQVYELASGKNSSLRFQIYKQHLDLSRDSKWGFHYSHTIEFLYIRELSIKNSPLRAEITKKLLDKYSQDSTNKTKVA